MRSPSRNYGPGPGGGTGGSGLFHPTNGSSGSETGSNRSSSSGQTRVKSSSPNDSGRSASSGHRTNGLAASDSAKSRQTAAHESGATSAVISRSRSPPVVTIAPTLSLSGLHYQDSRKVFFVLLLRRRMAVYPAAGSIHRLRMTDVGCQRSTAELTPSLYGPKV